MEKIIYLMSSSGIKQEIKIDINTTVPSIKIVEPSNNLIFASSDLFECLKLMRKHFDLQDIKILCNGARIDVFPSRLLRQNGKGQKAYVQRLGFPVTKTDIVNIFDFADDNLIGSIESQEKFHERWLKS